MCRERFWLPIYFSRYLEANENDYLLAISTSGNSQNILKAIEYANNNTQIITLTGDKQSNTGNQATIDISTFNSEFSDRIQELHIKTIHILVEMIERKFFPENYQV